MTLSGDAESPWLDRGIEDADLLTGLLAPYPFRGDGGLRSISAGQLSEERPAGMYRAARKLGGRVAVKLRPKLPSDSRHD